jgi:hypothetical protein
VRESDGFFGTGDRHAYSSGMPRYFYDVHYGHPMPDQEGEVMKDDEAAWKEATLVAGEIFKDIDGKFRPGQEWSLQVTDEAHKPIYHIHITSKHTK